MPVYYANTESSYKMFSLLPLASSFLGQTHLLLHHPVQPHLATSSSLSVSFQETWWCSKGNPVLCPESDFTYIIVATDDTALFHFLLLKPILTDGLMGS